MSLHLAIVGSADFVATITALAPDYEDVRFAYYTYQHPHEAATIAKQLGSFDGVFFSGSFPYSYALPYLSTNMAHHVVQDETVLLTTLLSAALTRAVSLEHVSIDVIEPRRLAAILSSLPAVTTPPRLMKIHPDVDFQDVFAFHADLQPAQTNLALTSIERVHRQLQEQGYESQLMIEPPSTIRYHLEQLIQRVRQLLADNAQFSIILYDTDSEALRDHLATVHYIGGHLETTDGPSTALLTTKGETISALEENTLAPASFDSSIGIGYGTQYQQAYEHAQIALSAATDERVRIVDDSKRLSFPKRDDVTSYRVTEEVAFDIVKQVGISPANAGKIIRFSKRKLEFTAKELTDYLNVSRRTTERLIKKLHDAYLVSVIGEEMSYAQGRPRAVYKFNFPA
ncbi:MULTISPECIES: HTH domain-containing protein [unclassified Exiguobacterium]|uniref:HTH domain-containing protein n=1 Tax=unclassified Exiguobacterium TaxID=2644629 RepID=UPI001040318D|nr:MULTISPECIES: HTH domain-containing protein [unclassified Exiguobacterium]TCI43585.1 HTH domain-containing protein [Exiguobacterium sp. SH5S32]TCI52531.1 HTH domain-containing protein [Exiguobacterium sp. SH1S4]TCI68840.1 HTH domain-containing protein [Exiguobacterium sp. SH1S1]